jgi:hypothetical protein
MQRRPTPQDRHPKEPPSRGTQPLEDSLFKEVGEPFVCGGETYRWRQFGLMDGCLFVELVESAISWGLNEGVLKLAQALQMGVANKQLVFILIPLMGMKSVRSQSFAWLASLILYDGRPIEPKSLEDPDQFPLHEFKHVLSSLSTHPGLESFFGSLPLLLELPVVRQVREWAERALDKFEELKKAGQEDLPPEP